VAVGDAPEGSTPDSQNDDRDDDRGRDDRDEHRDRGRPEPRLDREDARRGDRDTRSGDRRDAVTERLGDDDGAAEPAADRGDAGDPTDDESRPRRRRRRGRRGGRGRSRTESGSGERPARDERAAASTEGAAEPRDQGDDDEPLPTSYGMRPATRPTGGPRGEADREARSGEARSGEAREGDDAGEGRGRRRRRRRGGEGRTSSTRRSEGRDGDRGRRGGSRRSSGESRSSTLSRGRRDDFAPVAGRHDDDDEGLEFLGVEEAGHDTGRRARAPEDDEILAESGLSTVLDVPSWVEAIGIVIAGNLDARSKSGRGGDRGR
jgi:ribonuclease E